MKNEAYEKDIFRAIVNGVCYYAVRANYKRAARRAAMRSKRLQAGCGVKVATDEQ